MTDFLVNFHFLRPWWLLALLPAALAFALLLNHQRRSSQWQKFIDERLLPYLLDGQFSKAVKFPFIALMILWLITCIALAGPTWQKIALPVQKEVSALMILWDLSPSMETEDLKPSRLTRARLKLIDLLDERKEGLTGLIVYSGDAHMVTPLTDDTRTIESQLSGLSPAMMPSRGSNIEAAVAMADQAMLDAGITKGEILVLTDGIASSALPELKSIRRGMPHQVTLWGIGTSQGAPIPLANGGFARSNSGDIIVAKLDEETMNEAASALNALYVPFSNDELDIKTILNFSLHDQSNIDKQDKRSFDQWNEQGHWLALLLLPFVAFAFRRGWVLSLGFIFFIATPSPSFALGWQDLWLTPDQQAQRKLEESPAEAAELFNNESWRAAAQYKAGNYEQAQEYYRQGENADTLYNYANTLTQQGNYDEAIAAYDKALEQNPDFTQAKENKTIAEKLKQLEQQAQQQQDSQQQNQDQGEQSQDDQQSQNGQQNQDKQQQNQQGQGQQQDQSQQNQSQQGQQEDSQQGQQNEQEKNSNDQNQQMQQDQASEEQQQAMQQQYAQQDSEENQDKSEQQSRMMQQQEQDSPSDEEKQQAQQRVMQMTPEMQEQKEAKQALEQWLRKVPDDPSGLLRNKFQYEHNQRQREMSERQLRTPDENPGDRW